MFTRNNNSKSWIAKVMVQVMLISMIWNHALAKTAFENIDSIDDNIASTESTYSTVTPIRIASSGNPTPVPTLTNSQKNAICKNICVSNATLGGFGCALVGTGLAILFTPAGGAVIAGLCGTTLLSVTLECKDRCDDHYPV